VDYNVDLRDIKFQVFEWLKLGELLEDEKYADWDQENIEMVIEEGCRGVILSETRGSKGFGYDPIFFFPPLGKTFAELTENEKNRVSHRGKALRNLRQILREKAR
jgi:non-canonical purine NTP pyrophosphatase (RdgB/HAM1 family)